MLEIQYLIEIIKYVIKKYILFNLKFDDEQHDQIIQFYPQQQNASKTIREISATITHINYTTHASNYYRINCYENF